jgi:hypothetical protein
MRAVRAVLLVILGLGLGFIVFSSRVFSQEGSAGPEAPVALGSGFTYQGQLMMDGSPAEGSYDLQFRLYDAATGVGQVGSTITRQDVPVADGRFTVALDFGANAFDGQERWLEIGVRPGNAGGTYTTLAPRQPLTAAPYALYSSSAPWSGLTGVPAGLDDGDDDTTYSAGTGLLLSGTEFSTEGVPFDNVGVVAKSGGDFSSIQEALDFIDGIGDAAADNPYLVFVAPGVYEERVTLLPYVTVAGSGEGTTIVRWTGGEQAPWEGTGSATMVGADNASVRHLTVESDGTGKTFSVALLNFDADTAVSYVTAKAVGGNDSRGLANYEGSDAQISNVTAIAVDAVRNHALTNDGSSPHISDLTASASGGDYNYGVVNWFGSLAVMTDVRAEASGGNSSYGFHNNGGSPTMSNVTAVASDGSGTNYGVFNSSGTTVKMTDVTVEGVGGSVAYGVFNDGASPEMTNVTVTATGGNSNFGVVSNGSSSLQMTNVTGTSSGGTLNYGLWSNNSSAVIRHSVLEGSTYSISRSGGTVQVASSQLLGPVAAGLDCFDNYDENLNAVVCP